MRGDVCMVYDENGNAFDAFPYEPEDLERHARRLRGVATVTITVGPSPFVWFVNTASGTSEQA